MEKNRILVVDDELYIRELLCDFSQCEGIACDAAANVDEAISLLQQNSYRLILLDYHLGGERAGQVIKQLRAQIATTPILLLTGSILAEQEWRDLGVTGCLFKPFSFDEFNQKVKTFLEHP